MVGLLNREGSNEVSIEIWFKGFSHQIKTHIFFNYTHQPGSTLPSVELMVSKFKIKVYGKERYGSYDAKIRSAIVGSPR